MTTFKSDVSESDFVADNTSDETFRDAARTYVGRVRGGDMGSLPAVLGLVVLFIVFGLANERFMSALNLANLVTQAGSICVLAMGLVFVLLLGDIDLSAGVAGGVSACTMALVIADQGWPCGAAVLAGVVCGALIGFGHRSAAGETGNTVIRGYPRVLPWAARRYAQTLIGEGGSVRVDDPVIRGITIDNVPVTVGWAGALLVVVGFAGLEFYRHRAKVRAGLHHSPFGVVVARVAGVAVVTLGVTYLLNVNRSVNPNVEIRGIPYVLPIVGVLLIAFDRRADPHLVRTAHLCRRRPTRRRRGGPVSTSVGSGCRSSSSVRLWPP